MVKKLRQTKQKEIINEELKKFNSFFTAEELFIKANKKDSNFGIATVYRFLKDLSDKRQIHSYVCNRKTVYSTQDKSHCHFICENCGNVEHIQVSSLDFIKNKINGSICHFQIDITGLCDKCSKKYN
jgi:Fe2+ or Zn2+ uptake regulation protein